MWYEIVKFELRYRIKRPETYAFFGFLLLFSIVGVDFIFQGIELGLMKKNAPLVIAKTMGAITGIFMIMASMIMGVPVLRDYQYDTHTLLFVNPISKGDYLLGRFLGSFIVLLFIFSGLLIGMMIGSQMPWHKEEEMLVFNALSYVQSFVVIVLPTLFLGASLFFVTGMLSKKLVVVYTQGIVLFVVFLLTKAVSNEYLQGILDPFSLTTLTQYSKNWEVQELNSIHITFSGILLFNKLFWVALGGITLIFGYRKFSFSQLNKRIKRKSIGHTDVEESPKEIAIPEVIQQDHFIAKCYQLLSLSKFYLLSLLKEASFWAIVICGIIIIVINSVNLGTVYGVDSYPATHFIMAELQEMSLYFFIIILLFYSGELIWKERSIKQHFLNDATSIDSILVLLAKFMALLGIYVVLILSLILTGILFQISKGYYEFDLKVYFIGFFVEILPYLILYTIVSFFFQVISKNKFMGILLTLVFFIINIGSEFLGFNHSLYKFGGKTLGVYSEMNGYGDFLKPYLWVKAYWLVFGIMILLFTSLVMGRGTETQLWKRFKNLKHHITRPIIAIGVSAMMLFVLIGGFIFYNTNVINDYWTDTQEQNFRVAYEKELKFLEYVPQPEITDVHLNMELYPQSRSYEVNGTYRLQNTSDNSMKEIHIQKRIASHIKLNNVVFNRDVVADSTYASFDYIIYKLSKPLQPKETIQMEFTQSYHPRGFEEDGANTEIVENGTLCNNTLFPTIGYNTKYELQNPDERLAYELPPRLGKATIDDPNELQNARSGSDSKGINLEITIGTSENQTAVTSGKLIRQWTTNHRNYFQYKTERPIINLYSILSADYEIKKDSWQPTNSASSPVDLEIYHHYNHDKNVDRMMASMKASLSYYSENFSPYQYQQLRIMEFPRYADYAQSLPGTIPFSEALGFVLDIDDEKDVDMAFYITAHEVAHQWFGMQVEAANVQGRNFVLETLSQYAAIMVLKQQYSEEKVLQFLDLQHKIYTRKRKQVISEPSLALVENQEFIYYNKGAIAMYQLQQLIGEKQVNKALKCLLADWNTMDGKLKLKTDRYATTQDVLDYFRAVTPKESHGILYDLFETNTELEVDKHNTFLQD